MCWQLNLYINWFVLSKTCYYDNNVNLFVFMWLIICNRENEICVIKHYSLFNHIQVWIMYEKVEEKSLYLYNMNISLLFMKKYHRKKTIKIFSKSVRHLVHLLYNPGYSNCIIRFSELIQRISYILEKFIEIMYTSQNLFSKPNYVR